MRVAWVCVALLTGLAAGAAPVPKDTLPIPPVTEEHLKASKENLRRIALAAHNYESTNGFFPTNVADKNGKALLSWRVAILPYFQDDDGKLATQFRLNEPWDSDHNKALIEKMPAVYAPVRVKAKAGETFYQVFAGPGTPFGGKRGLPIVAITDGTSNTAMAVEGGTPVVWTKPDDLPYDPKKPLPKLGGLFDGDFHAALCDGSVVLMKKDYDAGEMRKLITHADGEVLDIDKLKK
jgi:hypothetical protein